MVTGLPDDLDFSIINVNCPFCVEGKATQDPYYESNEPDKETCENVGDEVFSDSFEPI